LRLQFQIDTLGDHLCTCTTHSGTKKTHDWSVNQFPDLFLTTHEVKTHQVLGSEVSDVGTSSWPDTSRMRGVQCLWCLTSVTTDKIRKYRADYDKKKIPLTLSPLCRLLLIRPGDYIVTLCDFYYYKFIGKPTAFLQFQEFRLCNPTVTLPLPSHDVFLPVEI
jgi:hypothetical protein